MLEDKGDVGEGDVRRALLHHQGDENRRRRKKRRGNRGLRDAANSPACPLSLLPDGKRNDMHFRTRIQHAADRLRRRPRRNRLAAQRLRGTVEQIAASSASLLFHLDAP